MESGIFISERLEQPSKEPGQIQSNRKFKENATSAKFLQPKNTQNVLRQLMEKILPPKRLKQPLKDRPSKTRNESGNSILQS
ncbi:MAG: hypothetical protein LBH37_04015 [Oscillospiraceae bacterium]|jgi:hypothetical protein|nr:hypothetical protein [Oscillospiraceae bacterium]